MGVVAGLYMYDFVVKITFAISSPDEFLLLNFQGSMPRVQRSHTFVIPTDKCIRQQPVLLDLSLEAFITWRAIHSSS